VTVAEADALTAVQGHLDERMPIWNFEPWSKQAEAIATPADHIRLLAWANRSGKTTLGAHEVVSAGMGWHPYIEFPRPPFTIWVCSVDYKQMRDSIIPALEGDATHPRMLPWGVELNQQQMTYTLPSGSMIRLKSAESGRKAFQGAGIPLIWIDEELPEPILREMFMRIGPGYPTRVLWTMTAVEGLGYPYDFIYVPAKAYEEEHGKPHPKFFYSEASMYEAPHLTDEQVEDVRSKFAEDSKELEVRVYGGFRDLSGDSVFTSQAITHHRALVEEPIDVIALERDPESGPDAVKLVPVDEESEWKIEIFRHPEPREHYCIGGDVAEGKMSNPDDKDSPLDWNAGIVVNRTFRTIDAVYINRLHPITFGETMWLLGHYYNYAWVTPEINSAGVAALGALTGKSSYPPYTRIYQRRKDFDEWNPEIANDDLGWRTLEATRGLLVATLRKALEADSGTGQYMLQVCDNRIVDEMVAFQRSKKGKPEHMRGRHDDLLFALGIALQIDILCPPGDVLLAPRYAGRRPTRKFDQTAIAGGRA